MGILIDIGHPASVYFFKNEISVETVQADGITD